MKRNSTRCFAATAAFVGTLTLLGTAQDVKAAESRVHSSQCTYYYDDAGTGVYNGIFIYVIETGKNIYCPVPSNSAFPHVNAAVLNIHGATSNANVSNTRACAHDAWGNAFECGATKYWSAANGLVARSVDTSIWNMHGDWFPYLANYLQAGAQLYGFWLST
jgi:hypothetical protein